MGNLIPGTGSTQRENSLLSYEVKQLFDQAVIEENGSISIHREALQVLQTKCSKWKNKHQTICLSPEVTETISCCLEDILNRPIPTSKPCECISRPVAERGEAEPTYDTPASIRPKVRVKVADPHPSGATKNFLLALCYKMEQHNMSLVDCAVQQLNEDDNNDKPVLVVCNNHSRLHADVHSTLTSVQSARYPRIILLVVHCQKEKHLSSLTALAQLRDTPDFKELRDVLDMAFDKNDGVHGIYDCDMNKRAFDALREMSSRGLFSDKNDIENDGSKK